MPDTNDNTVVYHEMCQAMTDLMVNFGLLNAVMPQYPEAVQERWRERMSDHKMWAYRMTGEVQEFAEHYDEDDGA